jgi:hypothetical protein
LFVESTPMQNALACSLCKTTREKRLIHV